MAFDDVQYVSSDTLERLQNELQELKSDKIPATARRIDEARQMGDLSENAEYHAAREEMAWLQSRVKELEHILDHSQIIKSTTAQGGVQIGSTIVVRVNEKEKTYTIVGAQEADPGTGKISNESPLGQAFLKKKKGDGVEVEVPAGKLKYTILEIQ